MFRHKTTKCANDINRRIARLNENKLVKIAIDIMPVIKKVCGFK